MTAHVKNKNSKSGIKWVQEKMDMELKKVWMSPETEKKSRYGYRAVGGILGIVLLMTVLLFSGNAFLPSIGIPRKWFSLLLICFVTLLGIVLSARLGRRGMQDAMIFFLTEDDRLWIMDARGLSNHGHGFWGFAAGSMETQEFLRKQGKQPFLPKGADEILKVMNIKENLTHYAVRCQARHPNKHVTRRTYFLVKGIQDQEILLKELERRKTWENTLEPMENRNPLYILLSGTSFAGCVILCVLSHPVVARMSGEIYFPCMGASLIAFCILLYFIIRQRRGE